MHGAIGVFLQDTESVIDEAVKEVGWGSDGGEAFGVVS